MRFPLRDAILSFQDPALAGSIQGSLAGSSTSEKGPLKVKTTEKHRIHKHLSRRKRFDLDPPALGEMKPTQMPRPPPEATKMPQAKKNVNTYGTLARTHQMRNAEEKGVSTWMAHAPPQQGHVDANQQGQVIRGTLTSSARAVLSHSRRYAYDTLAAEQGSGGSPHGGGKIQHIEPTLTWSATRQSRGLPRPVKEWVCKGLEFTDAGLGIGDRFDVDLKKRAERAPGHIYEQDFGNIARWKSEASQPTKQPSGKHVSTETHKMGARRDVSTKRDRQRPGPGTYKLMGFAEELTHKLSKRPRGEPPRSLSPPSSPSGSRVLQSSG